MTHSLAATVGVVIALLAALAPGTAQAELYRWTDAEGRTHYADKVPPEHVGAQRDRLSRRGLVVGTVKAEKTAQERATEERLTKLRAQQRTLIAEQKARDRVLLHTFNNELDLRMARDGKLAAIDVMIGVTSGNISRLEQQLAALQKKAAHWERSGKPVPKPLIAEIAATRRQIQQKHSHIERKQAEKRELESRFEADLARFSQLKSQQTTPRPGKNGPDAPELLGVVTCENDAMCAQAWRLAESYVKAHSTMALQLSSPSILMTLEPNTDEDIGITVTRIQTEQDEPELFLDLQCSNTRMGRDLCASEQARKIRSGFQPYITSRLD